MTEEAEDIAMADIMMGIRTEAIVDVKWLQPVVAHECC
jgi:hypothetical protein